MRKVGAQGKLRDGIKKLQCAEEVLVMQLRCVSKRTVTPSAAAIAIQSRTTGIIASTEIGMTRPMILTNLALKSLAM